MVGAGRWGVALVVVCAVLVQSSSGRAQGTAGGPLWAGALSGSGSPAAPAADLDFDPSLPTVYVTQGSRIMSINAGTTANGSPSVAPGGARWYRDYGSTVALANYPSPVPLKNGKNVIFFGGSDGKVHAINAADGSDYWAAVDLRVTMGDQVVTTPAVQLWAYSNAAFQNAFNDDVIFVSTNYTGAKANQNRVYALRASTGAVLWTYNLSGSALSYATDGCAIDYSANRIYCAFDQPSQTTQASLLTFDTTATSPVATPVWSTNAGTIHSRPSLRGTNIYVATYDGWVRCRSTTNGSEIWSKHVVTNKNFAKPPWPEPRAINGFDSYITLVDSGGSVYVYNDATAEPVLQWTLPSYGANSMVATAPTLNRLYIGKTDGTIHELSYMYGTETTAYRVGSSTGQIFDPALANAARTNGAEADRVYITSSTQLAAFAIPFTPCTLNQSTGTYDCSTTGGGGGGSCRHGASCSTACASGVVESQGGKCVCVLSDTCTVDSNGNPTGKTCCDDGTFGLSCTNTTSGSDPNNCGGCGISCPSGDTCTNGTCAACTISCGGTTPLCTSNNTCVCSAEANSCLSLGVNFQCNPITGTCACVPICNSSTSQECGSDGCGGTCGTCSNSYFPSCNAAQQCVCTTSPNSCAGDDALSVCNTTTGQCVCGTSPDTCATSANNDLQNNQCNATTGYCQCSGNSCSTQPNNFYGMQPLAVCVNGECQCTPNCTGKTCGNDGCGGSCGSCSSPTPTCNTTTGTCYCAPSCTGVACGGSDGCGGICSAGTCTAPNTCGGGGTANVCGCTPSCAGKACGASDGCGGFCSAGSCTAPQTCGGGGTANVCGCTPNCTGAACGASNGCGGICTTGTCSPSYDTCGGGGRAGVCGCTPIECNDGCTTVSTSNGCGGTCPKTCASHCFGDCCAPKAADCE